MASLGEERDERVGVKVFLARGCRKKVLVIKEEVGSVGFGGEAQERGLVLGARIQRGMGVKV